MPSQACITPIPLVTALIILGNVFSPTVCSRILFFRTEKELHSYLKTFLIYLNYLPNKLQDIDLDEIPLDNKMIEHLRSL